MLDIATLAFSLSFVSIVQALVIYFSLKQSRNYPGVLIWIVAYIFAAVSSLSMGARAYVENDSVLTISSNLLSYISVFLIYYGIEKFIGHEKKKYLIMAVFSFFLILISYFTIFDDDTRARIIIYSVSICALCLICANNLWNLRKIKDKNNSVLKIAIVFYSYGLFMLLRALYTIMFVNDLNFFAPSIFQILVFLFAMAASFAWAFGIIIIVLEREKEEKNTAKKRFELIFETSPDAMFITELENGNIVDVNDRFLTLMGYEREQVIGKTTTETSVWQNEEERNTFIDNLSESGHCENYDVHMKKSNGEIIVGMISASIMTIEGVPYILSIARDITESKIANDKLRNFSIAIEQSPVSIVITDINGKIEYANKKFLDVTGYELDEVIGNNPRILKTGSQPQEYYQELWNTILDGKEWRGEFHNKRKNGEFFWERASISPILNEKGEVVQILAVKEDVTQRKKLEQELEYQARIDILTGISNRRYFIESVEQLLKEYKENPKEAAFLMMDIDHFKKVNDNFGHAVGDVALKTIAEVSHKHLRKGDVLGRIGGEEFAVFLGDTDYDEAKEIAERLRKGIEDIVFLSNEGEQIPLRISIGISKYDKNNDNLETIMGRADKALYMAKNQGRNRVVSFD